MIPRNFSFVGWSWSAVFAGVIASLVFQILLLMAGMGFGLTSATDKFAVKLMLISDLTGEHSLFKGLFK